MPSAQRRKYIPSHVPAGLDPALGDWLRREFESIRHGLEGSVATGGEAVLETLFPVGALWISKGSDDPNNFLPGTWSKTNTQGRFLIGVGTLGSYSYSAGATGGTEKHTLTTNEMPVHAHAPSASAGNFVTNTYPSTSSWAPNSTTGYLNMNGGYTANAGGGASHENRPPYLAVNIWERTA